MHNLIPSHDKECVTGLCGRARLWPWPMIAAMGMIDPGTGDPCDHPTLIPSMRSAAIEMGGTGDYLLVVARTPAAAA